MSEDEFWSLTPYEFQHLLQRHHNNMLWQEAMAAVQPMLYAESHRDTKRRRKAFTLDDFTLSGMAAAARRTARLAKKQAEPEEVWTKVSKLFSNIGG